MQFYSYLFLLGITLIFSFAIIGCKGKNAKEQYHLPPNEMQKVLLDISLAEAYCSQLKDSLHREGTKNYDSLAVFYSYILNHYKLKEKDLTNSIDWYKAHPTELDSLCNKMLPVVLRWQTQNTNK